MTSIALLLHEGLETFSDNETSRNLEANGSSIQLEPENGSSTDEVSPPWKINLFALYARVFRVMLANWKETVDNAQEAERLRELDDLILPSNEQWRFQVYYRLVDLQREIDHGPTIEGKYDEDASEEGKDEEVAEEEIGEPKDMEPEMVVKEPKKEWEWEPAMRESPLRPKSGIIDETLVTLAAAISDSTGSMTEACIEPGWRVTDILLAADVLQEKSPAPTYRDEAEMRRVFGLVYDALRYKQILNQALQDVGFWYQYNEHRDRERIVWLLLYDMHGRKFSRRGDVAVVEARERAFADAGLKVIEDSLLETKTRLAASVSRLRIGGSALKLDELLPIHLRTAEGISWGEEGAIASGWVNTMKISSKAEFVGEMAKLQLRLCVDCGEAELDENHYVFDPLCPKVVNLHDKAREKLAMSDLVTSHRFVFLERSLCLGAAAIAQAFRSGRLCGPVVLTHSVAPRHTAYLAGLLADIEDAGRLLAFGTGEQRSVYEEYLEKLGVTIHQCRVFSERYASPPPLAELDRATVVLATPPCSYTGVKDIVDLAVARGGDTQILETLTNMDIELNQPRVLLTEQMMTLKHALTKPNVQMLIYEAHSILPSETVEVVEQVVQYANKMAADKYLREHPPKKKRVAKDSGGKSKTGKSGKRQSQKNGDDEEDSVPEVEIPDSDLFVIGPPTEIYGKEATQWLNRGSYLAVVKRKEMMQFNSLFMIKVAEAKGLFGDPTKQAQPKDEHQEMVSPFTSISSKSFKRVEIDMEHISAPTHASMIRSGVRRKSKDHDKNMCPRHSKRIAQFKRLTSAQEQDSIPILHPSSPFSRPSRTGRLNSLEEQDELIRRLSKTPTRWSINKKDSTVIYSNASDMGRLTSFWSWKDTNTTSWNDNIALSTSTSPSRARSSLDSGTRKPKFEVYGNASTFNFTYGTRALDHATRKVSVDERDKERVWQFPLIRQYFQSTVKKISRSYHPGGPLRYSRFENAGNPLGTSIKPSQDFPYLFPATGNVTAGVGLDKVQN